MNDLPIFFVRARSWGKFAGHVFLSVGGTNFAMGRASSKVSPDEVVFGGQVFTVGRVVPHPPTN